MRPLTLLFLLLASATAGAGDVYRWVDENGVVHYSDQPRGGQAERVDLPDLQKMDAVEGAAREPAPPPAPDELSASLTQPEPEQTFRDPRGLVPVAVAVSGSLPPDAALVYYLDGRPAAEPTRNTRLQLKGVPRGEHRLSVAITRGDREIARTAPVVFYMQPPSTVGPENRPDAGAPTAPPSGGAPGTPSAPRPGNPAGTP